MDPIKYSSQILELEIAYKLKKANVDFEFFELTGKNIAGKKPDFKLNLDNQDVYLEVTNMADSLEEQNAYKTFSIISGMLMQHDYIHKIQPAIKIHKILSKPHCEELKKKMKDAIAETINLGYKKVNEEGIIEGYFIRSDLSQEFKDKVQFGIQGPPINIDEIRRSITRIRDKSTQIPNKPGIIVIYNKKLGWKYGWDDKEFYKKIVYEVQESVYEYENITHVILITSHSKQNANVNFYSNDYSYFHNVRCLGAVQEDIILIPNRYSKYKIDINKIINIFKNK